MRFDAQNLFVLGDSVDSNVNGDFEYVLEYERTHDETVY